MRAHVSNAAYGVLDYAAYPVAMLVAAPILLRHLGNAQYGAWVVCTAVVSTGSIIAAGFGDANIQHVASSRGHRDHDARTTCGSQYGRYQSPSRLPARIAFVYACTGACAACRTGWTPVHDMPLVATCCQCGHAGEGAGVSMHQHAARLRALRRGRSHQPHHACCHGRNRCSDLSLWLRCHRHPGHDACPAGAGDSVTIHLSTPRPSHRLAMACVRSQRYRRAVRIRRLQLAAGCIGSAFSARPTV